MVTVLLVGIEQALRQRVARLLGDASVFVAGSDADALRQLGLVAIDIAVRAARSTLPRFSSFVDEMRRVSPRTVSIALAGDDDEADMADFTLQPGWDDQAFHSALRHAIERRRLVDEIDRLSRRDRGVTPADIPAGGDDAGSARVLRQFARVLAAGLDLPRTLETFLDSVVELLRPARVALLLPDADGRSYRVRAHRGLAPTIADGVRLPAHAGLCRWLTVEGRPARVGDLADADATRELILLQATTAVPLLAQGELVAVLVVGAPVVRSAYAAHEVETLFDLATHLASAIRGITLHQRLSRAGVFNERILEHMSNGVVTIGADERVGIINGRAAEILGLAADAVVGHDLRVLPSPLGDMLYETLTSGRAQPRAEVRLALRGLWLEVSTYPVPGDDAAGAVLVFEDLTAQKELATQKRQAEQFDLLSRVIARVADEIKNPLVSINTFIELIGERFDDPDFRTEFAGVVGRDVRRLVLVFEKLTGLVSQGELNFVTVDVHTVVDAAVAAIHAADDAARKPIDVHVTAGASPELVKVDAAHLRRALSYLVGYLGHHSPERAAVTVSVSRRADPDTDDVRVVVGSRTAVVPAPDLDRLFDPVRMVQESLIDIGPAVSQRIVEALGGRLEVRQGRHDVSFVVRLPAAL